MQVADPLGPIGAAHAGKYQDVWLAAIVRRQLLVGKDVGDLVGIVVHKIGHLVGRRTRGDKRLAAYARESQLLQSLLGIERGLVVGTAVVDRLGIHGGAQHHAGGGQLVVVGGGVVKKPPVVPGHLRRRHVVGVVGVGHEGGGIAHIGYPARRFIGQRLCLGRLVGRGQRHGGGGLFGQDGRQDPIGAGGQNTDRPGDGDTNEATTTWRRHGTPDLRRWQVVRQVGNGFVCRAYTPAITADGGLKPGTQSRTTLSNYQAVYLLE